MLLSDIFSSDRIKVYVEAEDKDEVFEELVDFFSQATGNTKTQALLDALHLREDKMSTGVKKGIGIPHGKSDAVDEVCGVLGISSSGIDYDALDDQPVHLVFMIFAPKKDTERHLRMLKRLAELFDNPLFYTDLLASKNASQANAVIKKYEEMLISLI